MEWIQDNWLILLLGGGMVAMHLFGHGHGGHGGHKRDDRERTAPRDHAGHRRAPTEPGGAAQEGATGDERASDNRRT